jgi:hypothetical protein
MQLLQILASFKLINFLSSLLNNEGWFITAVFVSTLRGNEEILTFAFTVVLYKKVWSLSRF